MRTISFFVLLLALVIWNEKDSPDKPVPASEPTSKSRTSKFFPLLQDRPTFDENGDWTEEAYRLYRGTGEEDITD